MQKKLPASKSIQSEGWVVLFFLFFQAEDGIRDHCVTGVQTCALPIFVVEVAFVAGERFALTQHVLAIAEHVLRQGESLACDERDLDYDGYPELWVHSSQFSALISPHRGGAIEVLTRFSDLTNLADVLTRRRESYHELPKQTHGDGGHDKSG